MKQAIENRFKKKVAQQYYDPDAPRTIEEPEDEAQYTEEDLPVVTPETAPEPDEDETAPVMTEPPPETEETFVEEIPERYFVEDEESLIEEAIRKRQCISFEYTSVKNRYLGWRLIEPGGIYTALGTANVIVVGYDRHRQGIRSFVISPSNMHGGTLKIMGGDFYHFEPKFVFVPR